jgi:MFS family permease
MKASLFSSLRHRNFRLYMAGQGLSWTGTWMQETAIGWLLYRLTHSTISLGWLGFCAQGPVALLITWTGVLADRVDRRRFLLVTQSLALGQALVLALLVWSHRITPPELLLLTLFLGIVTAFDLPARQALVPTLLDRHEDLPNAISLNSSLVHSTRLWGPAIAGMLLATAGDTWCFLINGLSYLATLAALVMIQLPPPAERGLKPNYWSQWKEGMVYAFGHRAFLEVVGLVAIITMVMAPAGTLMPAVAHQLQGGPRLYSALLAASAFGALVGGLAMILSGIKTPRNLRRLSAGASSSLACAMIAFSLTKTTWLALCWLALAGLSSMLLMVASNTWLQLTVPEAMRGRLMSLFSLALLGMTPVGCLLAGYIADRLGIYPAIRLGGLLCLAVVPFVVVGAYDPPRLDAETRKIYFVWPS